MKHFFFGFLFGALALSLVARANASSCSSNSVSFKTLETKTITTDVPSHLKGATIFIVTADQRVSSAPAELFKVVPRKQQVIVTATEKTEILTCSEEAAKNRISLLGGAGPKGDLTKDSNGSKVDIETKTGAIGGVQYQRKVSKDISVGGQVQTNKSGLISVGLDF